jgi:hypothetical protein
MVSQYSTQEPSQSPSAQLDGTADPTPANIVYHAVLSSDLTPATGTPQRFNWTHKMEEVLLLNKGPAKSSPGLS